MNPLISICLVTRQIMRPMVHYEKDIYTLLIESLNTQTFRDKIELIIVDGFFNDRKVLFDHLKPEYPFKYIPPKPSVWQDNRGYKVCNDRNSAIIMARGEMIIVLDDCTYLSNPRLLEQIWYHYQHWILLKPLLDGERHEDGKTFYQDDTLKGWAKNQKDTENFVRLNDYRCLETSGHRGGVFCFPAFIYEQINGFDENMDGDYGSEDNELNDRIDIHRYFRYIMENDQYPFVRVHHDEFKENMRTLVRYRCNNAYLRWKSNADPEVRKSANLIPVTIDDIEIMKTKCESCPSLPTCGRRINGSPPALDTYIELFRPFDLRKTRDTMVKEFGNKTGAFNPW